MKVKQVVPESAGRIWVGLEGTTGWPGHMVKASGPWVHGVREVSWTQRNNTLRVVVTQERVWLSVRTQVEFGGSDPPQSLVKVLEEADINVVMSN